MENTNLKMFNHNSIKTLGIWNINLGHKRVIQKKL